MGDYRNRVPQLRQAYNDSVEQLRQTYAKSHCVMRFFADQVKDGYSVLTRCSWPDWLPFVMPGIMVVSVTVVGDKDAPPANRGVLGWVRQDLLFGILGSKVRRVALPVLHFVCDDHIGGADQDAIRNLLMPTADEAVGGERGWRAL